MIARVRGPIRARTCSTSRHHVSGSQSTSTGTPPASITASGHEMIVNDGMITSSPGSRSRQRAAICSAAVPLDTATLSAEVVLRIVDVITGTIVAPELLSQLDRGARIGHPFLGYTARRSFDGLERFGEPGRLFRVRTNADGFRTHEFMPK